MSVTLIVICVIIISLLIIFPLIVSYVAEKKDKK